MRRPRTPIHWLALVVAAAATWLPLAMLHGLVAREAPGTLHTAEFVAGDTGEVPPDTAAWRPVTLPDDWRASHPEARAGWYRLGFVVPVDATGRADLVVHVPAVGMNAAVLVNGVAIGDGGRFTEPVARNLNRPLLFAVPPAAVVAGTNVLHLRVVADLPGAGFLTAPAVGPRALVAPIHARATFVRRTLLWALIVVRLMAAAFTAAIWAMGRRNAYYGWFTLSMLAWIVAELNLVLVEIPMELPTWYWLYSVAIGWWGICSVRLVLSFIGVSKPRAERALMVAGVVGSLVLGVLAVTGAPYFVPFAVNVWLTMTFGASCYLFRGVLPRLRDYPDAIELNVVFVVAASVIGAVLVDLLMQLGLRPRGGLTVPPYTAVVAVVGMGWVLVRRFVGALTEARAFAASLEQRVREKSAEVEASYARILAAERARVLVEERERILRDMDEGLGTQLVATLAMLERPEVGVPELQAAVRAALDDLRLVIDSLDPLEGDLIPALAMLRSRLQPRLDAAGIALEWRIESLPPLAALTPHRVLQILRAVQGVLSAALERGGGRLRVRTGTEIASDGTRAAYVEIADRGVSALRLALPVASSHIGGIASPPGVG